MASEPMIDRPLRSVFIGNIPYEVTEEKLKEIFSEVGPVVSMKLVYDRDTGKPKGYGFCEYKDVETSMSAMRNLNGYEINGRVLRVDNAGAERHRLAEVGGGGPGGGERERHQNVPRQRQQQQVQEDGHDSHFGNSRDHDGPPPPEKSPEVIGRAVASLPPEQMFELMKQMKMCIQNNPSEARTMLLQNPQLAYALLQAQVVMKIIDPPMALAMLHKDNSVPVGSLMPEGQSGAMMMAANNPMGFGNMAPPTENPWIVAGANAGVPLMPLNPPGPFGAAPTQSAAQAGDMDFRTIDPRMRNQPAGHQDLDLRDPRAASDRFGMDPRQQREMRDRDMRGDRDLRDRDHREISDPRSRNLPSDPRQRQRERERDRERDAAAATATAQMQSQASKVASSLPNMAGFGAGATDTEKAALIMQVLQLSDEQIAILPAEQRQSILVLKEQIAKSTQRS